MGNKTIGQPFEIRGMKLSNRIAYAPMGCCTDTDNEDGLFSDSHAVNYRALARGGAGLVIQGSTSVCRVNRKRTDQGGIWSDEQIPGLRRITEAAHDEGTKIIIQLQHAGHRSYVEHPQCSSDFFLSLRGKEKICRAMTTEEIDAAVREFAEAARRAVTAGYDGVELHGSHDHLIANFLNSRVNVREDAYGRDRMLIVREIYEGVRQVVPDSFVVGIRMSGFEPDLMAGLEHARQMDELGFDYLNLSTNSTSTPPLSDEAAPEGYPFSALVYAADEVKKTVKTHVFATKGIRTAENANAVLAATDVDMVQVGRTALVDPAWAKKLLSCRPAGKCTWCPKGCKLNGSFWNASGWNGETWDDVATKNCPGQLLLTGK